MKQYTETYHVLQMREQRNDEWIAWRKPTAEFLQNAERLAYYGRLTEAIEEAERQWIENYGKMFGVEFRCITRIVTVTANAARHEGWNATA